MSCGYHLGLARPRCGVVEGAYLTSALQSRESRRQFARVANGVTRFGLTLGATIAHLPHIATSSAGAAGDCRRA